MRSIQDVGLEILGNQPKHIYIFCGSEIGIKERYISHLCRTVGDKVEVPKVDNVLSLMRTKHIIPLEPKVYVVRYDEDFVAALSDRTKSELDRLDMVGTLVCIYELPKHAAKLDKYLGDFSVSIDPVAPKFISQYLKQEFEGLSSELINVCAQVSVNYSQARNMCRSLYTCTQGQLKSLSPQKLSTMLGYSPVATDKQIRLGVASRDFGYLCRVLEDYTGDADSMVYTILATMIEINKIHTSPKSCMDSDIREYARAWKPDDVYNMFCNAYSVLKKFRSISIADPRSLVFSLFCLLPYSSIPNLEDM